MMTLVMTVVMTMILTDLPVVIDGCDDDDIVTV